MKRILFFLIIFFITVNFAHAQYQNDVVSFRSKALGEVINDNLDLIYDPIELKFVSGIRLYTNLSNLTSTNEKMFDNYADNEFLAGLSFKNAFIENLCNSILIRFQNSKTSNHITLDPDLSGPLTPIEHYGIYSDEYTSYIDSWPYDGIYDIKTMISQTKSNFTDDNSYAFILNNTLTYNKFTIGLRLSKSHAVNDFNTSSYPLGSGQSVLSTVLSNTPDFSLSHSTYIIENNYVNDSWSENGDFLTSFKNSYFTFDGAFMMPYILPQIGNVELRFDAGYWIENHLEKISDRYNGRIDHFQLSLAEYDSSYQESDKYNDLTERTGGTFRFGADFKKVFNPQAERKNDGYWQVGVNFYLSFYDYSDNLENYFTSRNYFFDGLDTLQTDDETKISELNSTKDTGDENVSVYAIGGKTNIPLSEKVYFGIGGLYRFSRIKRETNYRDSILEKAEYTQIDSVNSNNFVTTVSAEETADRTWQRDVVDLLIPVGIEYKFTNNKKWAIRFGAIFQYRNEVINDAKQITNSIPQVRITEWGDGTIDIGDIPQENYYESTTSQTKTTTSTTTYTYGLGFTPTKSLQIDLLGFFGKTNNSILDSQFYRNLRLSFSIRF